MIYLDAAATTLEKPRAVSRAVARAVRHLASPGRGGYPASMDAAEVVFRCREEAAALFDAEGEQVVLTQNATHGLNLAISSIVHPGDEVVISGFEHNAVTRPLFAAGATIRCVGTQVFCPAETAEAFERAVTPATRAIVCTMVSNVFGYILPITAIAEIAARAGVPLIVDASQAAGALPVSLRTLGAAFIAMPGHKGLYGPQGTGLLLCRDGAEPLLYGGTGGQSRRAVMPEQLPERLEAGTQNVCGVAGLLEGVRFVRRKTPEKIMAHEKALVAEAIRQLRGIAGIRCFAGPAAVQAGVLSLVLDGMDCEQVAAQLARRGVAVRAGLHCAPVAHASAGTLETGTIRLSVSLFNTMRQIESAIGMISEFLE